MGTSSDHNMQADGLNKLVQSQLNIQSNQNQTTFIGQRIRNLRSATPSNTVYAVSDKEVNRNQFLTPSDLGLNQKNKKGSNLDLAETGVPSFNQSNTNYIFNGGQVSISGINNLQIQNNKPPLGKKFKHFFKSKNNQNDDQQKAPKSVRVTHETLDQPRESARMKTSRFNQN